jgi:hypothetical protein
MFFATFSRLGSMKFLREGGDHVMIVVNSLPRLDHLGGGNHGELQARFACTIYGGAHVTIEEDTARVHLQAHGAT